MGDGDHTNGKRTKDIAEDDLIAGRCLAHHESVQLQVQMNRFDQC